NQASGYWNECQESIRNGTWGSRQSQLSKKTTFLEAKTLYLEFKRNTRAFPAVISHLKPFSQVFDNECLSKITKDRIIKRPEEIMDINESAPVVVITAHHAVFWRHGMPLPLWMPSMRKRYESRQCCDQRDKIVAPRAAFFVLRLSISLSVLRQALPHRLHPPTPSWSPMPSTGRGILNSHFSIKLWQASWKRFWHRSRRGTVGF